MKNAHLKEQVATAVGLAVILSLAFYMLDWHQASLFKSGVPYLNFSMNWENQIPLSPRWTWVYFTYFPFLVTPLCFAEVRREIGTFRRVALAFGLQYGVAFVFFFLLPVRMERPTVLRASWSETALALLYELDPGFNVFPSLHVSNIVFVASLIWRLRGATLGVPAWILCGLITASTLLVKQHYAVDLLLGAGLGAGIYRLCFSWPKLVAWMESKEAS